MAMKQDVILIDIPKPDIQTINLVLVSDSRLVSHRWSEKARQQMMDKQTGKAVKKKEPKNPEEDYKATLYQHKDGWYGMPATAFKGAAVNACRYTEGITMVMARGVIFVESDGSDKDGIELVKVEGDGPHMREDMVRIGMLQSDIRHRGEWREWKTNVRVRYNANIITAEQIMNLFSLAGLHVGIGEGRPGAPKKSMDWGMFHVATGKEAKNA